MLSSESDCCLYATIGLYGKSSHPLKDMNPKEVIFPTVPCVSGLCFVDI